MSAVNCGPAMPCADCGGRSPPYMVYGRIWRRAGGNAWRGTKRHRARWALRKSHRGTRFLCISCLEARLRRRVRRSDFTTRVSNWWMVWRGDALLPMNVWFAGARVQGIVQFGGRRPAWLVRA